MEPVDIAAEPEHEGAWGDELFVRARHPQLQCVIPARLEDETIEPEPFGRG